MTWLDAVERVLRDATEPLRYQEIADRIMRRSLVPTQSRTPHITVHTSVSLDIRRRLERGLPPRFVVESGEISLAEWSAPSLKEALATIEQVREKAKRDLLKELRKLDGAKFESFVEVLLTRMGYDVTAVGGAGDDGIDLIADQSGGIAPQRVGVQTKCQKSNRQIGPNAVRILRDALPGRQCSSGAVIATATFNDQAQRVAAEAGRQEMELIGPTELAELAAEYGVGISARPADLIFEDLASVFTVAAGP